jgi:hypothetical protein
MLWVTQEELDKIGARLENLPSTSLTQLAQQAQIFTTFVTGFCRQYMMVSLT